MGKELQGFEEIPKPKIHLNSLRATFIKVLNWKQPGHDIIHAF